MTKRLFALPVAIAAMLALPAFASASATITHATTLINVVGTGPTVISKIEQSGSTFTFTGDQLSGDAGDCLTNMAQTVVTCSNSGSVVEIHVALAAGSEGNYVRASDDNCNTLINSGVALNVPANASAGAIIVGGGGADTINGGSGDDELNGCDGADTINGSDGNDHVVGGAGHDTADGGPGNDLMGMENEGADGSDKDTIVCGTGTDTINVDMSGPDGGPGLLPNDIQETSVNSDCERQLPHFRGHSTLTVSPQAGSTYLASNVDTSDAPSTRFGSAPDTFAFRWYLCNGPVVTTQSDTFAEDGAPIDTGCTVLNGGALTASITVPADAAGKYLGAVGQSGLNVQAGSVNGPFFASESWSSAQARLITAAPVVTPPVVTPPVVVKPAPSNAITTASKLTCKSAACKVTVKFPGAGVVTVSGATKYVTKTTKSVTAGTTTVSVKLTSKAKKTLKKKGKLSAALKVKFVPTGGTAKTVSVKVAYKVKKAKA